MLTDLHASLSMMDAFLDTLIVILSRGDTGRIDKELPRPCLSGWWNLRKTPMGLFLEREMRDFSSCVRLSSWRHAADVGTEH